MADYAKWDAFDAGSSDEEGPGPTPAEEFGTRVLSEWLALANPGVTKKEVEQLIAFIEVQQPHLGHADNRPRAADIIECVEASGAINSKHLLEVVWQGRLRESDDPGEAARLVRMKAALTSALNTSRAMDHCGGARALFDTMWKVRRTPHRAAQNPCQYLVLLCGYRAARAARARCDVTARVACRRNPLEKSFKSMPRRSLRTTLSPSMPPPSSMLACAALLFEPT